MYKNTKEKSPIMKSFYIAISFFVAGFIFNNYLTTGNFFLSNAKNEVNIPEQIINNNNTEKVSLNLFWEVWNEIEINYLKEDNIDYETMMYGSIKGMVDALGDPYSVFMTPEETKEFTDSLGGLLEGIGAELTVEEGLIKVVTPLKDSPAERAGIKPGDIIYKINDDFASDFTLFEAISKIRGPKDTEVALSILREGATEPIEMKIIRDAIKLDSVTFERLDSGIVYISINQFSDKTTSDFTSILKSEEYLKESPKAMILDLRYNGGGYLNSAVELLSNFVPDKTEAVIIRQKNAEDEVLLTRGLPKIPNIPILVLINEGSASASEILAGALRDHGKAVIMGVKSFGKGTVQEVEYFKDSSSIRLTIAKWLTPKGIDIDASGLEPDILVELEDEDYENKYDRQKEEAIKYLKNLNK